MNELQSTVVDTQSWQLACHPDHPTQRIEAITVFATLSLTGKLWLRYHIDGRINAVSLPDPVDAERADYLWQTTCCEIFMRIPGEEAYGEYNLSPSSRWAAYQFSSFREDMSDMDVPDCPEIHLDISESHLSLEAELAVPERFAIKKLNVSFSAIVEETDGNKSFWAVTHPPGKPEFHHKDCFSVDLEAREQP